MNPPKTARSSSHGRRVLPTNGRAIRPSPLKPSIKYNTQSHGGKVSPGWSKAVDKAGENVDSEDDEDEGSDPEERSDAASDEDGPSRRPKVLTSARTAEFFNLSLLYVDHQVHAEALPIFYAHTRFILDIDSAETLRLLTSLPQVGRQSITMRVILDTAFMSDDGPSWRVWCGSVTRPRYSDEAGLALCTPYGAFLAREMPKLRRKRNYSKTFR